MTPAEQNHARQQKEEAARAAAEAADRAEKERGVVALERIADALERLQPQTVEVDLLPVGQFLDCIQPAALSLESREKYQAAREALGMFFFPVRQSRKEKPCD